MVRREDGPKFSERIINGLRARHPKLGQLVYEASRSVNEVRERRHSLPKVERPSSTSITVIVLGGSYPERFPQLREALGELAEVSSSPRSPRRKNPGEENSRESLEEYLQRMKEMLPEVGRNILIMDIEEVLPQPVIDFAKDMVEEIVSKNPDARVVVTTPVQEKKDKRKLVRNSAEMERLMQLMRWQRELIGTRTRGRVSFVSTAEDLTRVVRDHLGKSSEQ